MKQRQHVVLRQYGPIFLDMSILEANQSLRVKCDIRFVSDQHNGDAAFPVELLKHSHDFLGGFAVESSSRLIGKNDGRVAGYGARQGHALLLSTRQLIWEAMLLFAQSHTLKGLSCTHVTFTRGDACINHWKLDVRERTRAGNQIESLEDETDLFIARVRQIILGHCRDIHAIEYVRTAGQSIQTADDVHHRRFPGS